VRMAETRENEMEILPKPFVLIHLSR
jgi:hypothetical protein